ncbi:MAG: DUF916 and DUF3324 domain-containing protein [Carnobacterium sp.]|uniref:DUF916 and DUF3324 domain-containing protein n=1 Tax=Carnobacterium sp. TaxID=48221 RepID=UPI002FCA9EA3
MNVNKLLIKIGLVGTFFIILSGSAYAEGINYSVKANIPENQIDKSKSYFDLSIVPGQKQTLSLTVKNTSKIPITVNIIPTNATTNQNGVIDYSIIKKKEDSSLLHPFTTLIDEGKQVKLEAEESKEIIFNITMPEETFDGIILGGFSITEDTSTKKDGESNEGVQIKNEYSFVIGVSLKETEQKVIPELKLNEVRPTLINYRTAVILNLQNVMPVITNGLKVEAEISKKGSSEILYKETKEDLSMAPNSNFDFPISLSNEALKAGEYEASVKASAGEENWTFKKTFRISADESKKLNDEAVEIKKGKNNHLIMILVGFSLIVLFLFLVIIILYKKERKRKEEHTRLMAMRRKRKKQAIIKKNKKKK